MEKIIVECPSCHKKMKVLNRMAKYKCPNCGHIYKLNMLRFTGLKTKGFFIGVIDTGKDIKNNIKYKFNSTRATYNYMKQMKKNMKNDPDWSNYHKEKEEERKMKNANKKSFKDFFKR